MSSTMVAPLRPPRAMFERPEADEATPLTFTGDGDVFGHLALWESCHRGFINGAFSECVKPPPSRNGYSDFHLGQIETAEGDMLPIGKLTYATGHASIDSNLRAATAHYDNTGSVGAFVRASNGRLGIWLSGAVRSDLAPEGLRDLRANPPSGDWRHDGRNLELIASLAVVVPGFATAPRAQLALSASATGEMEVTTLILPNWTVDLTEEEVMDELRTKSYIREREAITASLVAAPMSTDTRNALPRSAFAIPETRSYPINDVAHARNALARSSGKPEEGRVRAAVCRRYPSMGECQK